MNNSDEDNSEELKKVIDNETVEVVCELGKSHLTMDEINKMQPGDVIKIDKYVNEPAEILYNNLSKYTAEVGIKNGKYAIKVLECKEGNEDNG